MRIPKLVAVLGLVSWFAFAPTMAIAGPGQAGKPVAGCPAGGDWELWSLPQLFAFLGGQAFDDASLDGNGDGYTCVRLQELANGRKGWTGVSFRDNTVQ